MTEPSAFAGPQRVLSGVQPSGALHLGNYLGALVKFVALQRPDGVPVSAWSTCTPSPPGRTRPSSPPRPARSPPPISPPASTPRRRSSFPQSAVQRSRRAGLDLQLRRPARLARPDDPVQGQERQAQGARQRRPLHLSGAAGRRHPGLQGHPRAGGRGPEAAPGADPRHRRQVQPRLRRAGLLPPDRAPDRGAGRAGHVPARRPGEDVEVRPFRPVADQPDRRRRHHRRQDPPGQDRSPAAAGDRRKT